MIASTALPGLASTHSINGKRYIDGGVRSRENADLAAGYANVVVLAPLGASSPTPPARGPDPAGQFEGLRRPPEWGMDLASEVAALRKQGSRVEVITPDADSLASAMGTNLMDLTAPASPPLVLVSPKASGKRPGWRLRENSRISRRSGLCGSWSSHVQDYRVY